MPNDLFCWVSLVHHRWQMWSFCDVLERKYCTYAHSYVTVHVFATFCCEQCVCQNTMCGTVCSLNSSLFLQIILILVCFRNKLTRCQSFQVCFCVFVLLIGCVKPHMGQPIPPICCACLLCVLNICMHMYILR